MLRLRPLRVVYPTSLDEAVAALRRGGEGARLIAGGTDLLPGIKLGQEDPELLVSLRRVAGLDGVRQQEQRLVIGAGIRLVELADDPTVIAHMPALAQAVSRIASPQIRNMGTLGGNLCLDTRCRYINQSELFREALGGCLKSHGSECHVVPGGKGCVAALSADSAPVLIALGAILDLVGPEGERTLPLADLYCADGLAHTRLGQGELIVAVQVPIPGERTRLASRKWAVRRSIDFPLVSLALRLDLEDDADILVGGLLVVGVLGPRPRQVPLNKLAGARLDEGLAQALADVAFKRCRPLPNVPYDPDYRRERLAVEVRRAVRGWL